MPRRRSVRTHDQHSPNLTLDHDRDRGHGSTRSRPDHRRDPTGELGIIGDHRESSGVEHHSRDARSVQWPTFSTSRPASVRPRCPPTSPSMVMKPSGSTRSTNTPGTLSRRPASSHTAANALSRVGVLGGDRRHTPQCGLLVGEAPKLVPSVRARDRDRHQVAEARQRRLDARRELSCPCLARAGGDHPPGPALDSRLGRRPSRRAERLAPSARSSPRVRDSRRSSPADQCRRPSERCFSSSGRTAPDAEAGLLPGFDIAPGGEHRGVAIRVVTLHRHCRHGENPSSFSAHSGEQPARYSFLGNKHRDPTEGSMLLRPLADFIARTHVRDRHGHELGQTGQPNLRRGRKGAFGRRPRRHQPQISSCTMIGAATVGADWTADRSAEPSSPGSAARAVVGRPRYERPLPRRRAPLVQIRPRTSRSRPRPRQTARHLGDADGEHLVQRRTLTSNLATPGNVRWSRTDASS